MMNGDKLVRTARSHIGKIRYAKCKGAPYRQDPESGMTCYNFLRFVASEAGILIPEYVGTMYVGCWEMWNLFQKSEPVNGVAVFFNGRSNGKPGHIGIYIGEGTAVHLSKERGTVTEDPVNEVGNVMGYRRIVCEQ